MADSNDPHPHFGDKDALQHMVERQSSGMAASAEVHGSEMPGHLWAGADAAREAAIVFSLLWVFLAFFTPPDIAALTAFALLGSAFAIWKLGRSALLGWARLERLHRLLEEERWEIEHHRDQERDELTELYQAKGFDGKLLEDVVDVLMADGDRLLRVMLQEELGLTLETHEHPLKQGLFAALGSLLALGCALLGAFLWSCCGALAGCILAFGIASAAPAWYEKNRVIPAVVWNLAAAAIPVGMVYFILDYLY